MYIQLQYQVTKVNQTKINSESNLPRNHNQLLLKPNITQQRKTNTKKHTNHKTKYKSIHHNKTPNNPKATQTPASQTPITKQTQQPHINHNQSNINPNPKLKRSNQTACQTSTIPNSTKPKRSAKSIN